MVSVSVVMILLYISAYGWQRINIVIIIIPTPTAVGREVAWGWCSRSMNGLVKNSSNDMRLSGSRCRSPCSNFLQLSDTCTPGGSCTKVMAHETLNKSLSGGKIKILIMFISVFLDVSHQELLLNIWLLHAAFVSEVFLLCYRYVTWPESHDMCCKRMSVSEILVIWNEYQWPFGLFALSHIS